MKLNWLGQNIKQIFKRLTLATQLFYYLDRQSHKMSQHSPHEQSHTLTNPRLLLNKTSELSSANQYNAVKQQQVLQSPIKQDMQNLKSDSTDKSIQMKQQMQKTSMQQSPDFLRSFSLARNQRIQQLKQTNEQENLKISLNNSFQKMNLPQQMDTQLISDYPRQKLQIQQIMNGDSIIQPNIRSNLRENKARHQQAHFSDYQLDEQFVLAGTNLQKTQIVLTIQEKRLKPQQTDSNNYLEHQINPVSSNKMEIQESISQKILKNQLQQIKSYQPQVNFQQITFLLNDAKQKRQIRRLTPIKSLKKYILDKFGYSHGVGNCQKLHLFFYKLYPNQSQQICMPITNEQNLQLILSQYLKARKDIFIRFQNDGSLKKKIQRKNKESQIYQVQFDSDGQLEEDQQISEENQNENEDQGESQINEIKLIRDMIRVNKTQKSRYKGANMVRCAFCQKTNKDIESIKICGPFYGPFIQGNKKTKHYCHLLCALWCKRVFVNKNGELQKIPMQITRSQKKYCEYCQKQGAGLLCKICDSSMHYECGLGKCKYLWVTYELYCLKCRQQQQEKQSMEIEENEVNAFIEESNTRTKIQRLNQQMQMHSVVNINVGESFELQEQNSRTQSIPHQAKIQKDIHNLQLKIDSSSKIQVDYNEQQQEKVEILQSKCKPAKNKQVLSNVKIEELESSLNASQKPRRGRRPKPANKQ